MKLTLQTQVPLPTSPSTQTPLKLQLLPDQLGQAANKKIKHDFCFVCVKTSTLITDEV